MKEILPKILTISELHTPLLQYFSSCISQTNDIIILSRAKHLTETHCSEYSDIFIHIFERILNYRETSVSVYEFPNTKSALNIIVKIIPLCHFINTLIVEAKEQADVYHTLSELVTINTSTDSFYIDAPATSYFISFVNNMISNRFQLVSHIEFVNNNFNSHNINELSNLINSKSLKSIAFNNAFSKDDMDAVYKNIFKHGVGKFVTTLAFKSLVYMDASKVFTNCKYTTHFELSNCSFEISNLFNLIEYTLLSSIEFSGNYCKISPDSLIKNLPRSLVKIDLRSIEWEK